MVAKVTALVEFERTEFALKAVKDLSTPEDDEEGLKVMELIPPPPSKSQKNKKAEMMAGVKPLGNATIPTRRSSYAGQPQQPAQQQQQQPGFVPGNMRSRRISLYHNMKFEEMPNQLAHLQGNKPGLNPNAPTFQMQRRISRPHMIHPFEMMQMQHQQAAAAAAMAAMHPGSPWGVPRRMMGEVAPSGLGIPSNVLRMPRGPTKGSKGFNNWCRSRMTTNSPPPGSPTTSERKKKNHAVPIVSPQEEEGASSSCSASEEEEEAPKTLAEEATTPAALEEPRRIIIPQGGSDDSGNEDEGFSDPERRDLNERTR
ncbi:Hypothetical protein FKW44_006746 [Caligus rogercresseyi]|uniref:Uncharacterized protein n=1 Tax=Caligus rogercresseyi TaxID=217165 RepID=A0A7T8KE17_CALRO|nr:Hypothetical protein FKW44_006746 [Caligus rogercresseyi]